MELDRSALGLLEDLLDSVGDKGIQLGREGLAKHRVDDKSLATEERVLSDPLGSVDNLVGDDKVTRGDLLAQGSDGGEGDNGLNANVLERGDVGTRGHLARGDGVCGAVSGDEGDEGAGRELGDGDGRGRLAPRLCALASNLWLESGRIPCRPRSSCCKGQ